MVKEEDILSLQIRQFHTDPIGAIRSGSALFAYGIIQMMRSDSTVSILANMTGKDGTRAYVTGDFTDEGLIEDTSGLSNSDLLGIEEWNQFYKRDYKHIGRLIGHFYDDKGLPTNAMKDFENRLVEAKKAKLADEDDRKTFPPCNVESRQGAGRRIWCSNLSGGVQRDWIGLPRQYFQPGKTEPRCACVKNLGPPSGADPNSKHNNRGDLDNPQMKVYEDCDPKSFQCHFED